MTVSVKLNGLRLVVEGDYSPAEAMTHDYPGCEEDFDLVSVKTEKGEDITPLFQYDVIFQDLMEIVWDKIKDDDIPDLED